MPNNEPARLEDRIFAANLTAKHVKTDQLFFWLLLAQWAFAIGLALVVSPYSWTGKVRSLHVHVQIAVLMGGLINALPLMLIRLRPGWWLTRQTVAVAQMLWSGLLIHLTGGRIETHFHIFGSLAFLAFYRDWRLLPTATLTVAADHLTRGLIWPESVYGIVNSEWWRFLEHASWVVFEDIVLFLGARRAFEEMRIAAQREAALQLTNADIEAQVAARTAELEENMDRYKSLVENTNAIPWEYDLGHDQLSYIAPQATRFFGRDRGDFDGTGFLTKIIHPDDRERVQALIHHSHADNFEYRVVSGDGRQLQVRTVLSPHADGEPLRGITLDVTKQKKLEADLGQAQKLESVGRLASGVAHEINTPVQFVSDSVHFLREAAQDLMRVLDSLQVSNRAVLDGTPSLEAAEEARQTSEAADFDYLVENVPKAFDRSIDGIQRIATIVRSMKEFAHPDSAEMGVADLNHAIQSTLTIARSEYKYVAELETDLGELPPVTCHLGDVNQAVLNIVVNAAHAIGDTVKGKDVLGRIVVRTRFENDEVLISISDSGGGIPEEVQSRVFDPFFTTKDVGKGTGQGLAIARAVIVDKHHGSLSFDSVAGQGTTFYIRLPAGLRAAA